MKTRRKYLNLIAVILLIIAVISALFSGVGTAYAATSGYTNVLDDLRKDPDFNAAEYPDVANNYTLQVIQIAESSDGELLIYTYQPCAATKNLRASSINIAREMDNSVGLGFANYMLMFLNSSGVFYKYRVEGFELRQDAVRYYNISNILRPYDKDIDADLGNGQTQSEIPNEVAQFWTACTVSEEVTYTMITSEVIRIPQKYVGYVRYEGGFQMFVNKCCDSYFVAFSTDRKIDKLISASISYGKRDYLSQAKHPSSWSSEWVEFYRETSNEETNIKLTVQAKRSEFIGAGLGAKKYTWDTITTTNKFTTNATTSGYQLVNPDNNINDTQWILQFIEFEVKRISGGSTLQTNSTEVFDVMILELEFETEGKTYKLGVVDNKQTGSHDPTYEASNGFDFWEWLAGILNVPVWAAKAIIFGIAALIVLAIALPVLSAIFPVFGQVLKHFFSGVFAVLKYFCIGVWYVIKYFAIGVWWLISAPFRGIAALIRKRRAAAPASAARAKKSTKSKSKPRASRPLLDKATGKK